MDRFESAPTIPDPPLRLSPLSSASTASLIAERIRDALVAGILLPGSRLGEEELSRQMVVSRGPVREALHRLVQEGLLVEARNRGIFVPRIGAAEMADVLLARRAVETEVACVLVVRDGDLADAEAVVRQLERAVRARRWSDVAHLDQAFHRSVAQAAGSPRLERLLGTLLVETRIGMVAAAPAYRPSSTAGVDHRRLLDALAGGDVDRARRAVAEHLEAATRRFAAAFAAAFAAGADGLGPSVGRVGRARTVRPRRQDPVTAE